MTISEANAREAVRSFLAARNPHAAAYEVVAIEREEIEGRDCWVVRTVEAQAPGEPEWFRMYDDTSTSYFIDATSGRCIGLQSGTFRQLLPDHNEVGRSPTDETAPS
jgi:hypothetical protein